MRHRLGYTARRSVLPREQYVRRAGPEVAIAYFQLIDLTRYNALS